MNPNIKRIATETLQQVTSGKQVDLTNLEATIDNYVKRVIAATVMECASVVRDKARTEEDGDIRAKLKMISIDMEEHFGL